MVLIVLLGNRYSNLALYVYSLPCLRHSCSFVPDEKLLGVDHDGILSLQSAGCMVSDVCDILPP